MNETNYSPAKEFASSWWAGTIKPLIDFKKYLVQRGRILADPTVILTTPVDDRTWKSPLKFAIQGLVVPTFLASLIVGVYFFFVRQPEPDWKHNQKQFEEVLAGLRDLESTIKAADRNQKFDFYDGFGERTRDEALKECQRQIAELESRKWLLYAAPFIDEAEKKLGKFLAPTMLILGAYFFRWLLKSGQGRSGSNMHRAHEIYLYFVTSSVFWIGLIHNVFFVLWILSFRTESPLMPIFYILSMVLGIIALVLLNQDCKKLQGIFNLPLLEGKQLRKSGHHKIFSTIFFANLCSLVVAWVLLFVAAWGWGLANMWINRFRA